jgi:hypothetical protein
VNDKPPQKNLFKKLHRGQGGKLDGAAKKGGQTICAFVHFVCMPPLMPMNFKEHAGRSQGFHNHVHDPRDG